MKEDSNSQAGHPLQKVDHALALANAGFRVFPLSPNSKKPPKDFRWKESATVLPSQIRDWWTENADYNVGVATGNGILVIDADTKGGTPGLASLDMMDAVYDLPDSFRVDTPSGGRHVYVRTASPHQNRVRLARFEGIDLRTDGGYVVGPGSVIDGKPYTAVGNPTSIANLPVALDAELLRSARKHAKSKSDQPLVELDQPGQIEQARRYLIDRAPEAIEGAGGNDTTFRVACICRDYGLSEPVVADVMLEHWNEQKASPPWTPDDLAGVIANAFAYATGGAGKAMAAAEFGVIDIDEGEPPLRSARSPSRAPLFFLASDLAGQPTPERKWIVPGWIPAGTVTLLSGDGGTGKSQIALQLCAARSIGSNWLGRDIEAGSSLFLTAEDERDELHRRLADIAAHQGCQLADMEQLHLVSLADADSLLATADSSNVVKPTPLLGQIEKALGERKPGLVVLDTLADIFGGDENNRAQARQFVGLLRGLAIQYKTTVIVLAHPSLSGMASGTGSSGSTGWANSVRSRLYFARVKQDGEREQDPDLRTLSTTKANYGRTGNQIQVRWVRGVFVAQHEGAAAAAETIADRTFLELLRIYTDMKRNVSDGRGPTHAPSLFAKDPKNNGITKAGFILAMNRLFHRGEIKKEFVGPPSKSRGRIVAVGS